jgi:hypothetical protein
MWRAFFTNFILIFNNNLQPNFGHLDIIFFLKSIYSK